MAEWVGGVLHPGAQAGGEGRERGGVGVVGGEVVLFERVVLEVVELDGWVLGAGLVGDEDDAGGWVPELGGVVEGAAGGEVGDELVALVPHGAADVRVGIEALLGEDGVARGGGVGV